MESMVLTSSSSTNLLFKAGGLSAANGNSCWAFSPFQFYSLKLRNSSLIVAAKKNNSSKKVDTHSFVSRPDEATGMFPEAVLLKENKIQEDGRLLPEFADAEEQELYEALNLLLESDLDVERMRHYEVVYLIHEKHANEVESVNLKVQEFLKEKKGKVWRFSDWGLRRLAYKIQKATHAHYILMNFELEAKEINGFKTMLDKDERIIRHLVIKRDEAIVEECPPPPEFRTLRAGTDDEEEDDFDYDDADEYEDEDEDEDEDEAKNVENEIEGASLDDGGDEEGIIYVSKDEADDGKDRNYKKLTGTSTGRRKAKDVKVGR